MRLAGKVAVVVGAGQTAGTTIGNGRATAILFAREGASVLAVDRHADSAEETVDLIAADGGTASALDADVTKPADCAEIARACIARFGSVDVLHNNVGIASGDGDVVDIAHEDWSRILDTNLTSMYLTCRHVLPLMRARGAGAIVNISSNGSIAPSSIAAYKVSKAGVNALTKQIAAANAQYGIRCNAVLPGLMNTPMAIEGWSRMSGKTRQEIVALRDAQVPLGRKQGSAWDVAHASLFLASDDAAFITGALLPVDGGQSTRYG